MPTPIRYMPGSKSRGADGRGWAVFVHINPTVKNLDRRAWWVHSVHQTKEEASATSEMLRSRGGRWKTSYLVQRHTPSMLRKINIYG